MRDADTITVREAAAHTGRSAETIRRWVWSGRLSARKVGTRLLIARADLDAIVADGDSAAAPSLGAWLEEVEDLHRRRGLRDRHRSAADLILADRRRRATGGQGAASR